MKKIITCKIRSQEEKRETEKKHPCIRVLYASDKHFTSVLPSSLPKTNSSARMTLIRNLCTLTLYFTDLEIMTIS